MPLSTGQTIVSSVDPHGHLIRRTEEEARLKAEEGIRALDDILVMGTEEEQRKPSLSLVTRSTRTVSPAAIDFHHEDHLS